MPTTTVFRNNRTQAVRLTAEARLPEGVTHVQVRVLGRERVISPLDSSWDSFFAGGPTVTDDFLSQRAGQAQTPRESFE